MKKAKGNIKEQRARRYSSRKQFIAKQKNGKSCEICGYSKHPEILCFHHKEPKEKKYEVSQMTMLSDNTILLEIQKCILLCPNCHAEQHSN